MESWKLDVLRDLDSAHLIARSFAWAGEMPRMVRASNFGTRILEAKDDKEIGEAALEWANFIFHAGLEDEAAVEPAVIDALIEFLRDGKRAKGDVLRLVLLLLVVFLGKGPCYPPKLRSDEFVAVMARMIRGEATYPVLVVLALVAMSGSQQAMIVRSHLKAKDLEQWLSLTQDQELCGVLLEIVFWCACGDAEWMETAGAILKSYAKTIINCPPVMLAGLCALQPGVLGQGKVEALPSKFQPNMTVREFFLLALIETVGGEEQYRLVWSKSRRIDKLILNIVADNSDGRVRYVALQVIKKHGWKVPMHVAGVLLARMSSQTVDHREAVLIAELLLRVHGEEMDVRLAREILNVGDEALTKQVLMSLDVRQPNERQLFEEYNGPAILDELTQSSNEFLQKDATDKLQSWHQCVDKEAAANVSEVGSNPMDGTSG